MRVMILMMGAVLALAACKKEPSVAFNAEPWLGKWQGVEGTFLELARDGDEYKVIVEDLDGPRTFPATVAQEGIAFIRDGVTETIRAGTGADTGMKWLTDYKDCLVIKTGEGFCRPLRVFE